MRFAIIFLVGSWFSSVAFGQVGGGGNFGGGGGTVGGGTVGGGNTGGGNTGGTVTGTNTGGSTTGNTAGNGLNTNAAQPQDVAAVDVNQLLGTNGVTRGQGIGPSRTSVRGFSIFEAPATGQTGAAGARSTTSTRRGNTGGGVGTGGVGRGFGALGGISSSTEASRLVRSRVQLSSELVGGLQQTAVNGTSSTYVPSYSSQLNGIRGEVRGATATISGQVTSSAQRDLATRVMLLNPGVDRVDNQTVIRSAR